MPHRENSPNQHGGASILAISPLPLSPLRQAQGPSCSVEMSGYNLFGDTLYLSSDQPQTSVVCWKIFLSLRVFRSNR